MPGDVSVPDGLALTQIGPTMSMASFVAEAKRAHPGVIDARIDGEAINVVYDRSYTEIIDASRERMQRSLMLTLYMFLVNLVEVYDDQLERLRWERRWPN